MCFSLQDGAQYDEYGNRIRPHNSNNNAYSPEAERRQGQLRRPQQHAQQIPRGQNRNPDFEYRKPQAEEVKPEFPHKRVDPVLEAEIDD